MTATLLILWNTFGLLGLASALAWTAALGLVVAGIGERRRWDRWLVATAAAAVGLVLACATSASIRAIEVDRSAEVLAAEAAAAKTMQAKLRGRAATIRFAEDTAADQADIAGVTAAEEEGAYERAVEAELAKTPAYRSRGKQTRKTSGKKSTKTEAGAENKQPGDPAAAQPAGDEAAADAAVKPVADGDAAATSATTDPETGRNVRQLPESQLTVADRFDRLNRVAAWSVLAVAAALCCGEYVRRFNSTFDAVWPLPLAGTLVDGLAAKQRIALAPSVRDGALPRFLETAVRKGETFILFAADDPFAGRDSLGRLGRGRFAWRLPKRTFTAAEVAADPALMELVFESAWFGRAAFVLTGSPGAAEVVRGIAAALDRRSRTRAMIRGTLNLVWAWPVEPPENAALVRLANRINYRWLREAAAA